MCGKHNVKNVSSVFCVEFVVIERGHKSHCLRYKKKVQSKFKKIKVKNETKLFIKMGYKILFIVCNICFIIIVLSKYNI